VTAISLRVLTIRSNLIVVPFVASSVRLSYYARGQISNSYLEARYITNSPYPESLKKKVCTVWPHFMRI
jgi:hypothetical protein